MKLKLNIHNASVFFLLIYLILLPIDAVLADPRTNISYVNYVILIYIFFRVIEIVMKKSLNIKELKKNKLLIIFPIYFTFTVFFKQSELYSSFWITTFIVSYLVFFFSITDYYTEKDKEKICNAILFSSISVFLAAIFLGNTHMNGRLSLMYGNRTMDPNYFSVCLCMINSFCFYNLLNKNKPILYTIIILALFTIIIMTGSRGGVIANVVSIIVLLSFRNIKLKNKVIIIITLPIIIMIFDNFLYKFIPENVLSRYTVEYNEMSQGSGRFEIWKHGIATYMNNNIIRMIFGTGVGTFKYVTAYDGHVAHNMFIQTLVECGFLGIVMLITILYKTLKNTYENNNSIIFAALCGILVGAMSLDFINSRALWICLFLGNSSFNITNIIDLKNKKEERDDNNI